MKKFSNNIFTILFILFVISQFYTPSMLIGLYSILSGIIVIISLFYSNGLSRLFGIIMAVISIVILLYDQASPSAWVEGITKNLPLVCMIAVVPVLGIPIRHGQYDEHLAGMTAKFQQRPHILYLMVSGLFTLIAPITNMGSLYIIHSMLEKLKLPKEFLGRVYVRGVTSVHTWSPYFASVFLVVYSLEIPIYQYLPYGLLLSFFQVLIAFLLFTYFEAKRITFDLVPPEQAYEKRKLLELFAVLILLTGFIFAFEPFISWNVSVLIALIVLLFATIWSVYLNEVKSFFVALRDYRKEIFPSKANEINLLLTAGLFGVVLARTPISGVIQKVWGSLANVSVFVVIIATILIIAMLSFIGVHQIVTVSTIIATVSYDALGIDVIVMGMTLLSGWAVSTTISPITPVVTIVTSLLRVNPFTLILRYNLHYALVLALVHSLVIYGLHLLWFL